MGVGEEQETVLKGSKKVLILVQILLYESLGVVSVKNVLNMKKILHIDAFHKHNRNTRLLLLVVISIWGSLFISRLK